MAQDGRTNVCFTWEKEENKENKEERTEMNRESQVNCPRHSAVFLFSSISACAQLV